MRVFFAFAVRVVGLMLAIVVLQGPSKTAGSPWATARSHATVLRLPPRPSAARFAPRAVPSMNYYVAISAGGGAVANFGADSGYSGTSQTSHVSNVIDTSGLTNPAPQAIYEHERYGNFTYTVPGLTAGVQYAVRLHFAEYFWYVPRGRIFDVAINGTRVLTNFDIFSAAGGANKAIVEQFTAAANASGQIAITFSTVADNAKVSGIEVLPVYSPGSAGAPQYVNAGGAAILNYSADKGFLGGTASFTASPMSTAGTSNPAPVAVYKSERYGNAFTYTLGGLTPGAGYTVRLHFAEYFWHAARGRIFNVTLNGTPVISNLDIFANVGAGVALVEAYPATANGAGQIVVGFTTVADNAKVGGIELQPGTPASRVSTAVNITTHRFDTSRTGWNPGETVLTPATVGASFGALKSIALDEQVDAQPLVVSSELVGGVAHSVVYVATENDTVYALDAASGTTLWRRSLGIPVPEAMLPGRCNNNSTSVGVGATPVIDLSRNIIYVLADTFENNAAVYRLHALDLGTGSDRLAAQVVSASHLLADGTTTYKFQARESRSRAALLEANGNVYAAFSSYCDLEGNLSRGWVLGWTASALAPLAANVLTDRSASRSGAFLSSIWMSGSGPAADALGNVYFVTSNSDASGTTYGPNNLSESAVRQTGDLSNIVSFFTPSNVGTLDQGDVDFGSGGITLLPDQPGSIPHLAVAGGKDNRMFLLNRDALGGYTAGGPDKVLGVYGMGSCFCAEAYFTGSDGVGRVVTSGGAHVDIWKVITAPASLAFESVSPPLATGQDAGFFASVSSNGTQAGTAIVWAVSRPVSSNPANVILYAFNAATNSTLFSSVAGTWPNVTGNANIVPVVANGKVYVASYKNLSIFGLH